MPIQEPRNYIFNLETTKIELHFDKSEYDALPEEEKKTIRNAYLWSGKGKCWVSRAKEPNLYRAREVAKKLGFMNEEREGERLTFAEQLESKAERAENRADRYEQYAANAEKRGEQLHKPINNMHGDIAFFTQPIIAGHAGSQAFARRREKMFAQYDKGFEEYRKSSYFQERASVARDTANMEKLNDKAYLDRRIKECQKEMRQREKNLVSYEKTLVKIENGEELKTWSGEPITADAITSWINRDYELIEVVQDKEGFFLNKLDELGGVQFSKDNIKVGYIVRIGHRDKVEIISTGAKNVIYKILTGGAAGMTLKAAYAEITEIISAEIPQEKEKHPFCVGETFTARKYEYPDPHSFKSVVTDVTYEIVKASDTTIQLKEQGADNKPITRKPTKAYSGQWRFSVDDRHGNTFYKMAADAKS